MELVDLGQRRCQFVQQQLGLKLGFTRTMKPWSTPVSTAAGTTVRPVPGGASGGPIEYVGDAWHGSGSGWGFYYSGSGGGMMMGMAVEEPGTAGLEPDSPGLHRGWKPKDREHPGGGESAFHHKSPMWGGGDGDLTFTPLVAPQAVEPSGIDGETEVVWWNPWTWKNPYTWFGDWGEPYNTELEIVQELNRLFGTKHTRLDAFTPEERARIEEFYGQKFKWDDMPIREAQEEWGRSRENIGCRRIVTEGV